MKYTPLLARMAWDAFDCLQKKKLAPAPSFHFAESLQKCNEFMFLFSTTISTTNVTFFKMLLVWVKLYLLSTIYHKSTTALVTKVWQPKASTTIVGWFIGQAAIEHIVESSCF